MALTRADEAILHRLLKTTNIPEPVIAHYDQFRRIRDRARAGDTPVDTLALICVMAGAAPPGGDPLSMVTAPTLGQAIDWSKVPKGAPLWLKPPVDAESDVTDPPEIPAELIALASNGRASVRLYGDLLEKIEDFPFRTLRLRNDGTNWAKVIDEAPILFVGEGGAKDGMFLGRKFNGDLTIKLEGKGQRERIVPPWEVQLVDDPAPIMTPKS